MRPGVSEREAATAMNTIAARLAAQYPATNTGMTVEVHSLLRDFVGEESKALLVTSVGAILVLLIACANVANLTLARASTRERGSGRASRGWRLALANRSFVAE